MFVHVWVFDYAAYVYRIILLVASILSSRLLAQVTEAELRNRLLKKPLYLRGQWGTDSLTFDETGQLIGTSSPVTFTLSGIDITSIKLKPDQLVIMGTRVGLVFMKDVPKRVQLGLHTGNSFETYAQHIQVTIKHSSSGDYKEPLDQIFVEGLDQLLPALPTYWQDYGQQHFSSSSKTASVPASSSSAPIAHTSSSATAPRLLTSANASYNESAKALNYQGKVLLSLQVDASGKTSHFKIISPIGLGLDDRAVAAVSKYVFAPATQNGTPVAVEVRIEVNFQIY